MIITCAVKSVLRCRFLSPKVGKKMAVITSFSGMHAAVALVKVGYHPARKEDHQGESPTAPELIGGGECRVWNVSV